MVQNKEQVQNKTSLSCRKLKELLKEYETYLSINDKSFRRFRKISAELSGILPDLSDTTICSIDDILYPSENIPVANPAVKGKTKSFKNSALIATNCFPLYHKLLDKLWLQRPRIPILDKTYLQLLENTTGDLLNSEEKFDSAYNYDLEITNPRKLCLSLKFLKVCLDKDVRIINELRITDVFLRLSKLQKIPQAKDPQQRRLCNWLTQQCTSIISKIDPKSLHLNSDVMTCYEVCNSLKEEDLDENFINLLMRTTSDGNFTFNLLDSLYLFFKSAKDKSAKLKRLEDFLKGTYLSVKDGGPEDLSERFVLKIISIIKAFDYRLIYLFDSSFSDEYSFRGIEKYHKHIIKPYLSEDHNSDPGDRYYAQIYETGLFSEIDEIDFKYERDYAIEKFFYYDDFMRGVELLSIIHTAFLTHATIFDIQINEAIFRRADIFLRQTLIRLLKMNRISPYCSRALFHKIILNECPFLILPDEFKHMKQDVINVLFKRYLDIPKRESLYFIINSLVSVESGPYVDS